MNKAKTDWVGKNFGFMKVLASAGRDPDTKITKWEIHCQLCGETKVVGYHKLYYAKPHSNCGCKRREYKFRDLAKEPPFGKLTAKAYLGKGYWQCLCDCGAETRVHAGNLHKGNTNSCGRGECRKRPTAQKNYGPAPEGLNERDTAILALAREGLSCREIGNEFNLSGARIQQILAKLKTV